MIHPTTPNPMETNNEKEAFNENATTINRTAVAGNPQRTPKANLLRLVVCSPCIYSQNKLSRLTKGNAAMMPPYFGKNLATSVTMPIIIAETKILKTKNIFSPPD